MSESFLAGPVVGPGLWWYSARRPALILGTSQKPKVANLEYCREAGIEIYRRTSGGAAVLAEPDFVSLDVFLPPGHPLAPSDIVETYRWLGKTWLETLKIIGLADLRLVNVAEVRAERVASAGYDAEEIHRDKLARLVCFGSLSPYEVALGNRKLVGLAQIRRRAGTLLQCGLPLRAQSTHFSQLLDLPQPDRALLGPLLDERIVSLEEITGKILKPEEIVAAFEKTLGELWQVKLDNIEWPDARLEQANRLEQEKFQNLANWNK